MTEPDSTEFEQIRQTAEMFEMILQATPGAIENYESLKEAYRKLGCQEKARDVSLRLVDHYVQCNDLDSAKKELYSASREFPSDALIRAKFIELGFEAPDEDYVACMSAYEDACIRCEDVRLRLRLAEEEMRARLDKESIGSGKELGAMERDYRRAIYEFTSAKNEKREAEKRLIAVIGMLPEEERSRAEAEFAALTGEVEIVPVEGDTVVDRESLSGEGASRVDEIARQIGEQKRQEPSPAEVADDVARPGRRGLGVEAAGGKTRAGAHGAKGRDERTAQSREFGELLVKHGIITERNLEEALSVQKKTKQRLGVVIIELDFATEAEILNCLSAETGVPYLPLGDYEINLAAVDLLPENVARTYGIMPVDVISNGLLVAMANPLDKSVKEAVQRHVGGMKVSYYLSSPIEVEAKIDQHYQR
jgi:hypothetical protein